MAKKTKKKIIPSHLKPQRGLDSEIQRERRRQMRSLQRSSSRDEDRRREEARRVLYKNKNSNQENSSKYRWANSLLVSTAQNQSAVMRSMGLRQPINTAVDTYRNAVPYAYTDFSSITITYPISMVPERNERDATLETITDMRAIMQHEMGHIRFTVPFPTLMERYNSEVAAMVASSDEPNYVGFQLTREHHMAWNILEDQRMETLVVEAVPRIATYLTIMVGKHILSGDKLTAWILLAGREYLPKDIRTKAAAEFNSELKSNHAARQWFEIVNEYKTADTIVGMGAAVLKAYNFIRKTLPHDPSNGTDHMSWSWRNIESDASEQDACNPSNFDESVDASKLDSGDGQSSGDGQDSDGSSGSASQQDSDGNGTQKQKSGSADQSDQTPEPKTTTGSSTSSDSTSSDGKPQESGGSGAGTESSNESEVQSVREQIKSLTEQLVNSTRSDTENLDILTHANSANVDYGMVDAPQSGGPMNDDELEQSFNVMVGIQRALSDFETASQPGWQSRQDSGIIDPISYRTKPVGSLDYHRRLDGEYNSGLDVHVSMLCDVSGSMDGEPMQHLSIALYGTAMACQSLGIGASYTLWSTPGCQGRVWRDGNVTPTIWGANGGTDPTEALDDLDNHNEEGASNHLVIVFTDGVWPGTAPLSNWNRPGRHIVLCRLDNSWGHSQNDLGADHVVDIKSVLELPEQMSNAIRDILNK